MPWIISAFWARVEGSLFPQLEESLGPMTDKQRQLVAILELVRIEDFVPAACLQMRGRPKEDRRAVARAFVAKAIYNLATTRILIEQLQSSPPLRRICGWEKAADVPSESVFSRAFAEFARSELPQRVHEALVRAHVSPHLVHHVSRDSTEIDAREKAVIKPKAEATEPVPDLPKKRGRPKKDEERPPKEPTRIELQVEQTWPEALKELPTECDWGAKKDSNGKKHIWRGFKLHWDVADNGVPLSVVLTAASLHDSQVAIPLAKITRERVTYLYDLMDSAYDAKAIWDFCRSQGRVPIIDRNGRGKDVVPMDPATDRRYDGRSTVERANSGLKDDFGGRMVRVRGHAKVFAHLMFGVLALTADRLLHLFA